MIQKLSPEQLSHVCDPEGLGCHSIEEIDPINTIIGQPRAVRALRFGLGNKATGFNVFVSGPPGTGKMTAIKSFLEQLAKKEEIPEDWCYVNNFEDAYRPMKLALPAGKAKAFKEEMSLFIEEAKESLVQIFESEDFGHRREAAVKQVEQDKQNLLMDLSEAARQEGFLIKPSQAGAMIIPIGPDGQPISDEQASQLTPEERLAISQKQEGLQVRIQEVFRHIRKLDKTAHQRLKDLEEKTALFALSPIVEEIKEMHEELPLVIEYLEAVKRDILEHLGDFIQTATEGKDPMAALKGGDSRPNNKYEVNVVTDHSHVEGAPLVMELNPTHNNLFGRIEHQSMMGTLVTDFTLIRQGALHRANGGYLVLPIEDLLRSPFAYEGLKRAIRNKEINIEDAGERMGMFSTKSLQPEPIPLNVQVVLLGSPRAYHALYAMDPDFKELFKVKAEFDSTMKREDENISNFIAFLSKVSQEESLVPVDDTAIARMIEYASRLADHQQKLSTRFGEISDILREASHYAAMEEAQHTTGQHVKQALDERVYRSNLIQSKMQERVEEGTVILDVSGEKVGQINGLSVLSLGDHAFGMPNRITTSVGVGSRGLIDIEREAKLGGNLHTKGVMILNGYLASLFGQKEALSLSAQLVFEQSYGMIDGDSASSTELYALLSALSGVPINQGIAVTGSVNQRGEVQAIGGVNEKVEGYFEVCRLQGLTGEQGVMIPASNVSNLMLKEEVVQAVREDKFHIWAVSHIDEGIEVLTGKKAGRKADGSFSRNSIYDRSQKRLQALAKAGKPKKKPEPPTKKAATSTSPKSKK